MKKKLCMLAVLGILSFTIFTLGNESSQNGFLDNFAGLNAQTSSTPSCFTRTTSNCPVIAGQNGGQRVTCDLTGTYVPNSSCTPVVCTLGSRTPIICKNPDPSNPPTTPPTPPIPPTPPH